MKRTLLFAALIWASIDCAEAARGLPFRSPFDVAFSPNGERLAVSDHTAGAVALLDPAAKKVLRQIALNGNPAGVAWAGDGSVLFAAESGARTIAQIDPAAGRVTRRFNAGQKPMGLAVARKRGLLLAADAAVNAVFVFDLATGKERARIAVPREPFAVAVTPDESLAVVGNLLPAGSATDPKVASAISLIDLEKPALLGDIALPTGSTILRGVAVSPDGRWAYAVHTLGRFALPTTQLERGWVNTNALSILDLRNKKHYATLLLDYPTQGAADPWGVAVSRDGKTLWVSIAGGHQLAKILLDRLHPLLAGEVDGAKGIWEQVRKDPANRELLANDLAALYAADLITRVPFDGEAPRGLALSPDGHTLAVAAYFSGEVVLNDPASLKRLGAISLGPARKPDETRLGEMIFHDATYCFQHWLSCATCHPDARVDGLNWDLMNDGLGNPKNTRSMLLSYKTPPVMSLGVRPNMEAAAIAGFRFIQFCEPGTTEVLAVQAYLRSLKPEPSPRLLPNGGLSQKARQGKAIFESPKTQCATCHPAPLYTNLKMYDVGTSTDMDKGAKFDTPTLIELWRTAPYLHTGEAATLEEVFTRFNKEDKHGVTSQLSKDDLEALVEYLLSL